MNNNNSPGSPYRVMTSGESQNKLRTVRAATPIDAAAKATRTQPDKLRPVQQSDSPNGVSVFATTTNKRVRVTPAELPTLNKKQIKAARASRAAGERSDIRVRG